MAALSGGVSGLFSGGLKGAAFGIAGNGPAAAMTRGGLRGVTGGAGAAATTELLSTGHVNPTDVAYGASSGGISGTTGGVREHLSAPHTPLTRTPSNRRGRLQVHPARHLPAAPHPAPASPAGRDPSAASWTARSLQAWLRWERPGDPLRARRPGTWICLCRNCPRHINAPPAIAPEARPAHESLSVGGWPAARRRRARPSDDVGAGRAGGR